MIFPGFARLRLWRIPGRRIKTMQKKLITKSDIIFTVTIAAAVLLVWFFTLPRAEGKTVTIRQSGETIATLPLTEDTSYKVNGLYHNVFEIKGGSVRIVDTDCPNHQCKKTGSISRAGETIVCAPNGVTATITGGEVDVDGITGS